MAESLRAHKKKASKKKISRHDSDEEEIQQTQNNDAGLIQQRLETGRSSEANFVTEEPPDSQLEQKMQMFQIEQSTRKAMPKFASEPYQKAKQPVSMPAKLDLVKMKIGNAIPEPPPFNPNILEKALPNRFTQLPPITSTQNLNDIFQPKLQNQSMKDFKDYFQTHAALTGNIVGDACLLLTDAHLYELRRFDWPSLEAISLRACPQLTPFALNYIEEISKKNANQNIKVNVELMLHAHNTINNNNNSIEETVGQLEPSFGKSSKLSVAKVLVYHANSSAHSTLPSKHMIIHGPLKSTENASMLIDYSSLTRNGCQVSLLECADPTLFRELVASFHPQLIHVVVSNVHHLINWFFSLDCNTAYSILKQQQIRLIMNSKETDENLFGGAHTELDKIFKSAEKLYSQFIDETPSNVSENDDFRRNHYLTSLLHVQTKCMILKKKLTKDQCVIFRQHDPSPVIDRLIEDAIKYSKPLYMFDSIEDLTRNEENNRIFETNIPLTKLVNEFTIRAKEKNSDSATQSSTKIAQNYYAHKLINSQVLDIYSMSNGRSYFVADIDWFCKVINSIFNIEMGRYRKFERILKQCKQTLGSNIRVISRRDLKKLKLEKNEISFIQWLLNKWNIAYQLSIADQDSDNTNKLFVLFNSIASEPPVPLSTVWSESWPANEFEEKIYFHLLHPCDASILFQLYKLLPSQKLLLASKTFLLIQEGAIEILIQYHNDSEQQPDICMIFRALKFNASSNESDSASKLIQESFQYIVQEYYVIIWAFLFKYDYAFNIESKTIDSSNLLEFNNGNELSRDHWQHLALYHYSATPTLNSTCSVCGLSPSANKSIYNACTTLSPARYTANKKKNTDETNSGDEQSGSCIFQLDTKPISYTDQHTLRPDGFNAFEVIFLSCDNENEKSNKSILSSIQIGCLVNNFDIKEDEKVLFEYGTEREKSTNSQTISQSTEMSRESHLQEIRNFGGIDGLRAAKLKSNKKNELRELYTGLRLRINILYTDKPNVYELVFSINDIPWSRQTIKRKSTQTVFQPMVHCPGLHNAQKSINLIVYHHRSALDTALVIPPVAGKVESPWKVGMQLEAKDRKNPYILAIANIIEVYEDNRIRINFDGWTSTFDYTVETDNSDLHPCGYWEYVQRVLYKNPNSAKVNPHFTFTRFDAPKSYEASFSWRNYLTEKNQDPVPFECFNYVQTEGMTLDFFPHGIAKAPFACLSCRHHHNVRVKYNKMNTYIQDEIANKILSHHHIELISATYTTSPGVVLLPTPLNIPTLAYPCLKQFQNSSDVVLHVTCNHRSVSPLDASTILSGAHLMDTAGLVTSKTNLSMSLITLCMLTAVDLVRNQRRLIAPVTSKLISSNKDTIDKSEIDYYIRRWLDLSAYITCFHVNSFHNRRSSSINQSQIKTVPLHNTYADKDLYANLNILLNSILMDFYSFNTNRDSRFGKYGECYYCCLFRKDEIKDSVDIPIAKRIEMVGDYASIIFYFELFKQEKSTAENSLTLNDDFFIKFNGLEIIDITNIIISHFQLHSKNASCLKYLSYLSLENNDLSEIQVDFQYVNELTCLKLVENPLESLPFNCLSSKSLQTVEMSKLGRLIEIDPAARFSPKLKTLIMTESVLTTLPQMLSTDARAKLTKLTLNGPSWWGVTGLSVNEVIKYDSFLKRFVPFLDYDELEKIYRLYDEDVNGVLTFSEINLMNAHMYRYISRLRSTTSIAPGSGRSSAEPPNLNTIESDSFKQESFSADLSGIPSVIFYLENLTELTLEYQGIKIVPDAIKNLKYLTILNLNYCIELETLSAQVGFLPLRELNLTGCVSLKTPPIEITRRGHSQTMAFLQRLISGSTRCKRTKLMLVGLGGAGKTSLVRTFLESHSNEPPTVTDGIDIVKWKVPLNDPDDFLEFSVWDFAGQSVYYHTHQFFLAKKAVYVLAWNIRLGAEHAGLDFWLSSICCHAPNAPIFVVGTHSDLVSRIDLRQDDLKRRYPQIAGFFNVSTYKGDGVSELIENIIKTTLQLPYMDEEIPKAWLSFEQLIAARQEDILEYTSVAEVAQNAGIFDPAEVLQAVQFLHDLGSLQYFSSEHLKNYVVINPQWIINVMACIVSIRDSPVKNGRLFHSDIDTIWRNYDEHLHPWILKLTEAFDLTFPVPDQNMNLVPCLLPEEEPEYAWDDDLDEKTIREMKVTYTFNYLPAGLFNRAQVRLFQFSDQSTIWRYGSLLVKNNHRAVIMRSDDRHIIIKIQGVRPDNVLFLIHEVFEGLVNESFFGVTYDIAFPCPDCLDSRISEPWQFTSSLINRAIELKSPSIQCHRFFHVASVTDLQALIPPDSNSNYDLHLEYSVRDLKSYKHNVAVDAVYLYPAEHIPTESEFEQKVDPRKIKNELAKRGLTVWSPESMQDFKIENHYLVMKEARFIIFGISTELIENPRNKNVYDAFQVIINILRKPIIPLLFGDDMKWKETDIGVALSDRLYVNMQNIKRYEHRIKELNDLIDQENGQTTANLQIRDQPTDVFISYCWANSHDAVNKGTKPTPTSIGWADPRGLKDYLESRGLCTWMDITRLGRTGVLHDIVHGLKNTKIVIACVSDEYTKSEVCRNEFLFAKNTLRLPVILAIFGTGDKWRTTEVGMCSLACPQVNFQFENPSAFEDIYDNIERILPKQSKTAIDNSLNTVTNVEAEQTTTAAYQELFELTQRKFLRVTTGFADTMNARPYPRLFAIDFMGEREKSAQELARIQLATEMNQQQQQQQAKDSNNNRAQDLEAERERDLEVNRRDMQYLIELEERHAREYEEQENTDDNLKEKDIVVEKVRTLCVRVLCENEENWHVAGSPFEITEQIVLQNSTSYLTRIMLLLKQSDLSLEILTSSQGEKELQNLNEIANSMNMEARDSYAFLRRCVMDCDLEDKYCGLKQCLMPSGKVLWLCEEHQKQPRVVLVTGSLSGGYARPQAEEKSEIMKALTKLNEKIANNEMPAPTIKVATTDKARRTSTEKPSRHNRLSKRFSQQESTALRTQRQNVLLIDQDIDENDADDDDDGNDGIENTQPTTDEAECESSIQRRANNTVVDSRTCSIM